MITSVVEKPVKTNSGTMWPLWCSFQNIHIQPEANQTSLISFPEKKETAINHLNHR